MKLDAGSLHLMRLADRERDAEGWAKVSATLWPLLSKLPDDLLEKRQSGDSGHVRLTPAGNAVIHYS